MGRGRALLKCNIALAGQYRDYPFAKVSSWIQNLGGSASTSVHTNTTHVVATEKAWKRKDATVTTAMRLVDEEGLDIKIVSFDWLEDSVNNKTKKREGPYLWTKLDGAVAKHDAAHAREEKAKKAKSHVGMMAEVFQESTEKYVDPRQAKEVEKQIKQSRKAKEALEKEERREKQEKKDDERRKKAETFGKGAKKARNEIFTENHHIYADETGFAFDVMLTKVDTRHNRNERWAITIYESNAEPRTYACNLHFGGTNTKQTNNIMTAIGSPFAPAYHQFKKLFKEKTRVEWDDRIEHAIEQRKKDSRERGQAAGSEDHGSRKGVAVSSQEEKEEQERKAEKEFEAMPFEYQPPRFGARGKLPKDKEVPAELISASNTQIETWMSGANGPGPERPVHSTEHGGETEGGEAVEDGAHDLNTNNDTNDAASAIADEASNIMDHNLSHWVGNNFDDLYPFDHTAENLEYLAQTNGEEFDADLPSTDTFDTGMTDFTEFQGGDNGTSPPPVNPFDNIDTDMTEPPISFDLPSTVQESFELGTQDISESQMALRAQNEFLEFAGLPANSRMADTTGANMNDFADTMDLGAFDLGYSILGKRKSSPIEAAQENALKSARYDDEDEAFAVAAEESFDPAQDDQFVDETTEPGGDVNVPRAMLGEYDFGAVDEAIGEMDGNSDTGMDDWASVANDELPGRA